MPSTEKIVAVKMRRMILICRINPTPGHLFSHKKQTPAFAETSTAALTRIPDSASPVKAIAFTGWSRLLANALHS